jgi:GNAT superfamily N-acetyltransferase
MTKIRIAQSSDAASLAQLRYSLRSISGKNVELELEFHKRCTSWMYDHLQQNNWRCFVAEEDDAIIGALWLQLIEKIPNPNSEAELYAYITNAFVKQSERNRGLGSRLLTEALTFCREQSVAAVILWPSKKSRTLYERRGFAVPSDLLELNLGYTVQL